jgi:hypothetical protein
MDIHGRVHLTLRAPLKRCQLPAKHLVTIADSKIPDDHVTPCNCFQLITAKLVYITANCM